MPKSSGHLSKAPELDLIVSGTLVHARETVRTAAEQCNRGNVFAEIAEARAALLRAMKEAEAA